MVVIVLFFVVYFGMLCYGEIKFGFDYVMFEFSFKIWLFMLFVVGMGIGLMFFGVVELFMYFLFLFIVEVGSIDVVCEVMKIIFFYWGVYVWVIYVVVVLILGYFVYCQNLFLILCLVFYLLIGDCIYGWFGYVVDIFVVIFIVFGVFILLGFGVF